MDDKEKFVIEDLLQYGEVRNLDWVADFRYSNRFFPKETTEALHSLMHSRERRHPLLEFHKQEQLIVKRQRLAVLRELSKKGWIESYWSGTGEGGLLILGTNRIKKYRLTTFGKNAYYQYNYSEN